MRIHLCNKILLGSHNEMDKGSPQGPDPLPLGSHGWFLTRTVLCLLKKTDNLESVGANESYGSGAGKISELAAMRPKGGLCEKDDLQVARRRRWILSGIRPIQLRLGDY